ncbi:hypothetical protein PCLA_10f0236 [Pseudomonas citronellolis]|uniref:esterase-like activity of phytase family protein n=1 Tax=Pseudomonas citronellolis TaxID=53408 RepID=UPI000E2E5F8E|nr:esterase-like activity of phytase family protein [Pseudomonas citronellolis]GBL58421.1 hypothetical protein PCLA_10f0236 [Pseudomonas citronellolis]
MNLGHGRSLLLGLTLLAAFGAAQTSAADGWALLGEQRLALRQSFQYTTVGGLSGIDYDSRSQRFLTISDDTSEHGPARAYWLDVGPKAVKLEDVILWRQADGSFYPSKARHAGGAPGEVPDFESLRIDPRDGSLWYTSEGNPGEGVPPSLRQAARDGSLLRVLALPAMFAANGVRDNLSFEGLSFAADGASLWLAMEGPLYQDGEPPTRKSGAYARFTQLDREGRALRQVAYPLDPLPADSSHPRDLDSVSEILALDDGHLLVLERVVLIRGGGRMESRVRLYQLDLDGASDVLNISRLAGADFRPGRKQLLLDFADLQLPRLDLLEGMAWGPRTADGRRSLVLVSDDNFDQFHQGQVTQVLWVGTPFEVGM